MQRVIGMLITDEEFRRQFEQRGAECLASLRNEGIELTDSEQAALIEADASFWTRLATEIDGQLRKPGAHSSRRTGSVLTPREHEVLRGVSEGLTNKQIGARVGVSEYAVKATIQQLFHKTHVRTRAQLVRIAMEGTLGNPPSEPDPG
jgi:DNA-binding NarL/FixJ family response regulator